MRIAACRKAMSAHPPTAQRCDGSQALLDDIAKISAKWQQYPYQMFRGNFMSERPFDPSSVTKPIQLLSAWLVGLIITNGSFLSAATIISKPYWAPGFLVICSALCVPIFLASLFVLQTKFRPQMQEDSFYAKYLERVSKETKKEEILKIENASFRADVESEVISWTRPSVDAVPKLGSKSSVRNKGINVAVNDLLDNFDQVLSVLSSNKIGIDQTFGSTSEKGGVPDKKVLSIGRGRRIDIFKKILKLLKPIGFNYVSFAPDFFNEENIYIGSYIYEVEPDRVKLLTDELYGKIMQCSDIEEVADLLS